jgi:hypothetical protein
MRLRGVRLILVLLALFLTASFSTPLAWAGTCHTTHATFYCGGDEGARLDEYCGRRSVKASWDWPTASCIPTGCDSDGNCQKAIERYGCSWWSAECANYYHGISPPRALMWMKFKAGLSGYIQSELAGCD